MADATLGLGHTLSLLVYGQSKAGKSLLAVSGPAPRVLLDVESAAKLLPLKAIRWEPKMPPPVHDGSWDTAVVSVKSWDDARRALDMLQSRAHPFNSVALDSVSELQYRNIEKIAGGAQPQLQQWGQTYREIGTFCRQLRDLTEHEKYPVTGVIVTSMAKKDEDEKILKPFLQGQMKDVIPYLFDINGFLEKKKVLNESKQWVEVRDLYTEETQPKKFIAGGRITGRVTSPLRLPVVTGNTIEEISKRNITFRKIISDVFAMNKMAMLPATPIPDATVAPAKKEQGVPQ